MRKSVKLAAASTLAAIAMVGGSASAASANDWLGDDQVNVCGNDVSGPLASADRLSEAEIEDVDANGHSKQVICQNGEDNFAVNYNEYEGDFVDGDLLVDLVDATADVVAGVTV
jgi:hypothetical protein